MANTLSVDALKDLEDAAKKKVSKLQKDKSDLEAKLALVDQLIIDTQLAEADYADAQTKL